jgi:hypothetical protein
MRFKTETIAEWVIGLIAVGIIIRLLYIAYMLI